jgi:hypothetical protein
MEKDRIAGKRGGAFIFMALKQLVTEGVTRREKNRGERLTERLLTAFAATGGPVAAPARSTAEAR